MKTASQPHPIQHTARAIFDRWFSSLWVGERPRTTKSLYLGLLRRLRVPKRAVPASRVLLIVLGSLFFFFGFHLFVSQRPTNTRKPSQPSHPFPLKPQLDARQRLKRSKESTYDISAIFWFWTPSGCCAATVQRAIKSGWQKANENKQLQAVTALRGWQRWHITRNPNPTGPIVVGLLSWAYWRVVGNDWSWRRASVLPGGGPPKVEADQFSLRDVVP